MLFLSLLEHQLLWGSVAPLCRNDNFEHHFLLHFVRLLRAVYGLGKLPFGLPLWGRIEAVRADFVWGKNTPNLPIFGSIKELISDIYNNSLFSSTIQALLQNIRADAL